MACKLVEFCSSLNHLPEKPVSKVLSDVRGASDHLAGRRTEIDLAVRCREGSVSEMSPRARGQSPPPPDCRKSTIETQVDPRSCFPLVSVNSKEMLLPDWLVSRVPEKPQMFCIKNKSSSIKT